MDSSAGLSLLHSEALVKMSKTEVRKATMLERIRRPYAEYKNAHPRGNLCHRCASVNWSLLLPSEASYYCEGSTSFTLFGIPESSQELSASSCPFCLFLSFNHSFGKSSKRILGARCACGNEPWRSDCDHSVDRYRGVFHPDYDWMHHALCLELMTGEQHLKGSLHILQPTRTATQGFRLRKIDPGVIDYEILRQWLKRCQRHHSPNCDLPFSSNIPGLRVFDCEVGKVVAAPENTAIRYIALSYVWGGVKIPNNDQADFPLTISDAITVTLEMGYKYLWVDQLVRRCLKDGLYGAS